MMTLEEPKLAAPGAGLPWLEQNIAYALFHFQKRMGSPEEFTSRFIQEREAIRRLVLSCPKDDLGRRILIERPVGLEDSSRNWSILMTLDHLRIVNQAIAGVMRDFIAGKLTPGEASTARVKPSPDVTNAVIEKYEVTCDALLSFVSKGDKADARLTYYHPWFGHLNFRGWHALAGGHMGIHRGQIAKIISGLNRSE